jgi:hypothetical protein
LGAHGAESQAPPRQARRWPNLYLKLAHTRGKVEAAAPASAARTVHGNGSARISPFPRPRDWPAWQSFGITAASTTRYRSAATGSVPTGPDRGRSNSARIRSVRQPNHPRSLGGAPTANAKRPPCRPRRPRHQAANGGSNGKWRSPADVRRSLYFPARRLAECLKCLSRCQTDDPDRAGRGMKDVRHPAQS